MGSCFAKAGPKKENLSTATTQLKSKMFHRSPWWGSQSEQVELQEMSREQKQKHLRSHSHSRQLIAGHKTHLSTGTPIIPMECKQLEHTFDGKNTSKDLKTITALNTRKAQSFTKASNEVLQEKENP